MARTQKETLGGIRSVRFQCVRDSYAKEGTPFSVSKLCPLSPSLDHCSWSRSPLSSWSFRRGIKVAKLTGHEDTFPKAQRD
ncbi:hypothetical protein BaRGS_00036592 [Batillaria attramentaria]|uniref:Uncharacterized protein n=1 Tax=Batillaria attramentaria TaxID=370345 RepID=A0ABD0JBH0_9CAEN